MRYSTQKHCKQISHRKSCWRESSLKTDYSRIVQTSVSTIFDNAVVLERSERQCADTAVQLVAFHYCWAQ